MSQKTRIEHVKVDGAVYVDTDVWSRNPERVMTWLCDGWRGLFNNFRARHLVCSVPHSKTTFKRTRDCYRALPQSVISGVEKMELSEWIGGLRRIKTTGSGRAPHWKRRKDGLTFAAKGSAVTVRKLSKHRGEVVIGGQNPPGLHGPDGARWQVRIRFRTSRAIRAYTSVRVNWTSRQLVFVNMPEPIERTSTGAMVGLDAGVAHTFTTSDGRHLDMPVDAKAEAEYKRLQRTLARQDRTNEPVMGKRGKFASKRRQKTHQRMRAIASKQQRRRDDWIHKTTTQLVRDHDVIVVENLLVKNMTASVKGKGRAAKAGLNRGILGNCWGKFFACLEYKASLAADCRMVKVAPQFTSRRCHACGHIARSNRESQAVFKCVECGHTANADINAGANILALALGQWSNTGQDNDLGRGGNIRPVESSDSGGTPCEASTPAIPLGEF